MTATLDELAAGLAAKGYTTTVAGLGGNIVGIEIVTAGKPTPGTTGPLTPRRWVITRDDTDWGWDPLGAWLIGRDDVWTSYSDETEPAVADEVGVAATASLANDLPTLVGWADQIMGEDR